MRAITQPGMEILVITLRFFKNSTFAWSTSTRFLAFWGGAATFFLVGRAAFHRDETRTKTIYARVVFIAGILVDCSFAPEWCFFRNDRQAVRLDGTIATTLADEIVDDDEFVRCGHRAALAAPAFLGCTGLCVDQHGDAGNVAQLTLDRVEFTALRECRVGGEFCR